MSGKGTDALDSIYDDVAPAAAGGGADLYGDAAGGGGGGGAAAAAAERKEEEKEEEEEEEEEEEDSDDDFEVTMGLESTTTAPPTLQAGKSASSAPSAGGSGFGRGRAPGSAPGGGPGRFGAAGRTPVGAFLDLGQAGVPGGVQSIFEVELEKLDDKPWRRPGADATDFFNYGFDEATWTAFAAKQLQVRLEHSGKGRIAVFEGGRSIDAGNLPADVRQVVGAMPTASSGPRPGHGGPPPSHSGPPPPAHAGPPPPVHSGGPPPAHSGGPPTFPMPPPGYAPPGYAAPPPGYAPPPGPDARYAPRPDDGKRGGSEREHDDRDRKRPRR